VLSRHVPGSGYSFYRTPEWGVEEPNPLDTLAALRTLRLLALPVPERQLTADWLRSLQADDGSFPTLTIGWASLGSLAELGVGPRRRPASGWLAKCERVLDGHGDRDWSGTVRDALHLLETLRLAGHLVDSVKVGRLLKRSQHEDGGWAQPGADLETTAVALLVADSAGVVDRVSGDAEAFLRRCEDPVLGLRMSPHAGATSVGALWGGAVIAERLKLQLRHPDQVGAGIALCQRADGGFGPRPLAISSLKDTWLGVATDRLLHQSDGTQP